METSVSYILRARKKAERRRRRRRKLIFRWTLVICAAALLIFLIVNICGAFSFYSNVRGRVTAELGEALPEEDAFLRRASKKIVCETDFSQIDASKPGDYPVKFRRGLLHKTSTLRIEDTKAPEAELQDVVKALGDAVKAEEFVVSVTDASEVTYAFETEPDVSREGEQTVKISFKDAAGNKAVKEAKLTLTADHTAPVIEGAKDIEVEEGESISYKSGVTVTDDTDPAPKLEIDNSAVDPDKPGTYEVIYTAKDAAGNEASLTVKVTVKAKQQAGTAEEEKVKELADKILAKILKDDMTQIEKAFAIFRWVRLNVPWYGGNVNHDPVEQALKGLQGNSGDCYTDTCACQALLTQAGFETKFMQRSPGIGLHYWLMVKVDGSWYHMDPAPIYLKTFICFLGTDSQIQWFTDTQRPNYYTHDTEGLPETPEKSPAEAVYKDGDYTLVVH